MPLRLSISDSPRQVFSVRLANIRWTMRVTWHPLPRGWYLDIYESSGSPVLLGIRLTAGRRLLQGYRTEFRGDFYVSGEGDPPRDAWNKTHRLIWLED